MGGAFYVPTHGLPIRLSFASRVCLRLYSAVLATAKTCKTYFQGFSF